VLFALPGMPGYVTVQSPSQKSSCRLSEFAEQESASTPARADGVARENAPPMTTSKRMLLDQLELCTTMFRFMTVFLHLISTHALFLFSS
jgi:hypothetical protein